MRFSWFPWKESQRGTCGKTVSRLHFVAIARMTSSGRVFFFFFPLLFQTHYAIVYRGHLHIHFEVPVVFSLRLHRPGPVSLCPEGR